METTTGCKCVVDVDCVMDLYFDFVLPDSSDLSDLRNPFGEKMGNRVRLTSLGSSYV